jgi:hypothetical protein
LAAVLAVVVLAVVVVAVVDTTQTLVLLAVVGVELMPF